jgi:hypothetical protein
MKVIFLDIDGVLNCSRYFLDDSPMLEDIPYAAVVARIDPAAVLLLNTLVTRTAAVVVISSTWRLSYPLPILQQLLRRRGFEGMVVGATPQLGENTPRGHEISLWVEAARPRKFVILDDDSDMEPLGHYHVATTRQHGLLQTHVDQAVEILQ